MQYVLSAEEAKSLDLITQNEFGLPGLSLMENAALSFFYEIENDLKNAKLCIFVAGCGNNGADAIAAARIAFSRGYENVRICALKGKESPDRAKQRAIATFFGVPFTSLIEGDLIIDGLYGIGLKGDVRDEGRKVIEKINSLKTKVISIDCPSGLGDKSTFNCIVKAERTVTFGFAKKCFFTPNGRAYCGSIKVVNPSFAPDAMKRVQGNFSLLEECDLSLPKMDADSYKNKRGHVAIFGGSDDFTGAVRLSSRAAFLSGAGLVTVYTDEHILPIVASENLSPMVRAFDNYTGKEKYDCILFGPGIGKNKEALLEKVLKSAKCPVVIDADGVSTFKNLSDHSTESPLLVFTPHLGELRTLSDNASYNTPDEYFSMLDTLSRKYSATIVAKSSVVTIADGKNIISVDGANPALGVAGSGDVLSGIIASILCQGKDVPTACLYHQMAGHRLREEKGFFTSEELVEMVGRLR
ncbi:MAG: NAD(P)H-hydrate dehydratase [Sphaerochaetaceae bacterium]|nr:NAD(P)H-hydrate dehydratase [Sphaerochaetaceae bacterium]